MRIAFYAPMKPPDHPVPSGDRRMARLLIRALGQAGHGVEIASRFCSRDGQGDPARQARLSGAGRRLAGRLLRRYAARPPNERPQAWFTYHLYYKAPDWIGPGVAKGLSIPYLVAEPSVAPKRAGGPWDLGHRATLEALAGAQAVISLNAADLPCLPPGGRVCSVAPFLDAGPYQAAAAGRARHRAAAAEALGLDPAVPWIIAVAMMRQGDKLRSYRLLAEALRGLTQLPWRLLVAGDGPARGDVETLFAPLAGGEAAGGEGDGRVLFLGELDPARLVPLLAAADLFAWPAIGEAYGMALLEAQAAGLAAVAGASGGVPGLVEDGTTGLLTVPGDSQAFAAALESLLRDPARRRRMGEAAQSKVANRHGLEAAAARLDGILRGSRSADDRAE